MKKSWVWIFTIFMAMVMVGVIIVQVFWIKNSILIREQQFNQLIINTLSTISLEIQRNETVDFVLHQINNPNFESNTNKSGKYNFDTIVSSQGVNIQIQQDFQYNNENNKPKFESNITIRNNDSVLVIKNESTSVKDTNELKGGKKFVNIWDRINHKRLLIDQIMRRMLRVSPKIEERITKEQVEEILKNAFSEKGIELNYEYAITRWNTIPAFYSKNYSSSLDADYFKVKLFPDDIYSESNYLIIYFPDKHNYIVKSMSFFALSSILLTVILLLTFAFILFYILRQKKLTEIRNDFVNNMTHELKTPISTISLAAQMLNDKSIPLELKKIDYISGILKEESKQLGYQVEKVLQMAVFDRGKLKLKIKKADLHEIINTTINNFSLQIKYKQGSINSSLNAKEYEIEVDTVHITNVITNLLDNALKYCNRTPEIHLETFNNKEFFVVSVKDNGIGISKYNQKKIFDKFYRIPTGNIHNVKGFGLGLSYVKKIIEEHKGYIKLESEQYEGSTFNIYLPLKNQNHD